ncbi:hypothetical protein CDIK_3709 [Cucumispora dikerogammari]|nr:hypothetical protein CDIK_3709 [Cucumispora dikerogammari]
MMVNINVVFYSKLNKIGFWFFCDTLHYTLSQFYLLIKFLSLESLKNLTKDTELKEPDIIFQLIILLLEIMANNKIFSPFDVGTIIRAGVLIGLYTQRAEEWRLNFVSSKYISLSSSSNLVRIAKFFRRLITSAEFLFYPNFTALFMLTHNCFK